MPERPDLRKIAADIKDALASYPREALVDILTYVFQAYVVEGAPTVQATQPERLSELEGLAFPDLVQALQVRLDVPELALLEVANGRVSVRVGGELVALVLSNEQRRAVATPLSPAQPAAAPAAAAPTPNPGVQVVETASAPRPRGISVNPTGGAGAARPAPSAPAPARPAAPAAPAQAAAPKAPASADDPGDDDSASKRFSLLEID